MELRVLRYFLAVVREQSISRAAVSLHITQPTLSRQLMELENEVGIHLLNRANKSRKITLTDEGLIFYRRAQELVALANKIETEFSVSGGPISGDIYIGGAETNGMRLIAKAAVELRVEYPDIHYHLISGNALDLEERLDSGIFDFAVLLGDVNLSKYDHLPLGLTDVWGVLMCKDSPLAAKEAITREDLADVPLILSRQAVAGNELTGWNSGVFSDANVVATYNLIYNASIMVSEGLGYAICLDKLVNTSGDSDLQFVPLSPKLEASLYLVWKKQREFSKGAALFLDRLRTLLPSRLD